MENLQQNSEQLTFEKVWLMFQETDKQFKETDKKFKETDKQIKELGKQIGGLGNKFGTFNEGLFMPSLIKMLEIKFNCFKTASNYLFKDNGNSFEIDVLGISDNSCYIIEIKSHLRDNAIEQIINKITLFNKYAIEYSDKIKFGGIVATHYNTETVNQVLDNGLYFISTSDDIAKLNVPDGFQPKAY